MLTLVQPYYDHQEMLERQLECWNNWPTSVMKRVKIVVIDDGSPKYPFKIDNHWTHPALDIKIYRVKKNILWNTPGVKNLGFTVAESDWVVAADMDLTLTAINARKMLKLNYKDKMKVYWPKRHRFSGKGVERIEPPHCNSFIMNKQTFWDIGGFDEDFAGGWGREDSHFHDVAKLIMPIENIELEDIFFDTKLGHKGKTPTVDSREGMNRNHKIYHKKMKNLKFELEEFDAETVRTEYRPGYHSDNPLRFEWEQVL